MNTSPPVHLNYFATIALFVLAAFVQEGRCQNPASATTSKQNMDWKDQFKPKLADPAEAAPSPKVKDRVTYTLNRAKEPTDEELAAYERITAGMDRAMKFYNKYTTDIKKHVTVNYSPGTPTADGNINGNIRMGKTSHNARVCMHEICHTVGIGTSPHWGKLVKEKIFTGKHATRQLQEITGDKNAVVHADRMHFWPYGLNFDNEVKSDEDLINHCKMVEAIYKDLQEAGK